MVVTVEGELGHVGDNEGAEKLHLFGSEGKA